MKGELRLPPATKPESQQQAELMRLPRLDACTRLCHALRVLQDWDDNDHMTRDELRHTLIDLMRIVSGDPSYREAKPEDWEI